MKTVMRRLVCALTKHKWVHGRAFLETLVIVTLQCLRCGETEVVGVSYPTTFEGLEKYITTGIRSESSEQR